ncbi:LamG-like jellyroll fold domain-containing protein [Mariniflexile sp. AS56]|uniref:LamG-like jellyroll fold domain-containing protein n=1 Tax=Mariniflexile sp. AS56 TaxID=3063957 RepID=UPI0026EDDED2|nr:LamG-like jellyroll fold domain-containing protein [Mariniflexile sp. AS56]MDO7172381.1 LamG-like jellyroll fold domain-containing protein [Mariniflexile sp. AS56]
MKQKTTFLKSLFTMTVLILAGNSLNAQTLEAHYKFDGNLLDETTNWNLTESTGFTAAFEKGQDGVTNGAVTGFTAADYLETATDFSISGNASRTMAAWIKLTSIVGSGQAIVGLGEAVNFKRWTFQAQGVKLRIEIQGKGFNVSSPDLVVDTWYHVAVVFDNSVGPNSIKLYINGAFLANNNWQTDVDTTASKLRVGNDYNGNPAARGFTGAIDDLRIYSGAADDAFISSLYSSTVLGVNDIQSKSSFNAYPNPVTDRLYFSTKDIASVEIYNLLGSKISTQKVKGGVDMSALSKGIYLVKCQNSEGVSIATVKAIKK